MDILEETTPSSPAPPPSMPLLAEMVAATATTGSAAAAPVGGGGEQHRQQDMGEDAGVPDRGDGDAGGEDREVRGAPVAAAAAAGVGASTGALLSADHDAPAPEDQPDPVVAGLAATAPASSSGREEEEARRNAGADNSSNDGCGSNDIRNGDDDVVDDAEETGTTSTAGEPAAAAASFLGGDGDNTTGSASASAAEAEAAQPSPLLQQQPKPLTAEQQQRTAPAPPENGGDEDGEELQQERHHQHQPQHRPSPPPPPAEDRSAAAPPPPFAAGGGGEGGEGDVTSGAKIDEGAAGRAASEENAAENSSSSSSRSAVGIAAAAAATNNGNREGPPSGGGHNDDTSSGANKSCSPDDGSAECPLVEEERAAEKEQEEGEEEDTTALPSSLQTEANKEEEEEEKDPHRQKRPPSENGSNPAGGSAAAAGSYVVVGGGTAPALADSDDPKELPGDDGTEGGGGSCEDGGGDRDGSDSSGGGGRILDQLGSNPSTGGATAAAAPASTPGAPAASRERDGDPPAAPGCNVGISNNNKKELPTFPGDAPAARNYADGGEVELLGGDGQDDYDDDDDEDSSDDSSEETDSSDDGEVLTYDGRPSSNHQQRAIGNSSNDGSRTAEQASRKVPAPAGPAEVIELLDDDDDDDDDDENENEKDDSGGSNKRQKLADGHAAGPIYRHVPPSAPARAILPGSTLGMDSVTHARQLEQMMQKPSRSVTTADDALEAARASAAARASQLAGLGRKQQRKYSSGPPPVPPPPLLPPQPLTQPPAGAPRPLPPAHTFQADRPYYIDQPLWFQPTWYQPLAPPVPRNPPPQRQQPVSTVPKERSFRLSLLNVNEFTITGLPTRWDGPPTPVTGSGLRGPIRRISREYGKAEYERDKEGGEGKWRIPLGAYHAFVAYLRSDPDCRIEGIPAHQLQIASLERVRQEKGYPTGEKLVELGVPEGLAVALAPYQRGGCEFVVEKRGRALIADEMGLGKTIQAIAAMSVYFDEWPLLVLTPSSARYHWECEFQSWLGRNSHINKPVKNGDQSPAPPKRHQEKLLDDSQIHVLTSSKDDVILSANTKVVVCSYGLALALIQSGKIRAGLFRCAIADESHMLKNKNTKRTAALVPVLNAASRCILLSGTPALAKPSELLPQLQILRFFDYASIDAQEYTEKYVKKGGKQDRAELHTLLTGTVMIRRMKAGILKGLPRKSRAKASLHVLSPEKCKEFKHLLSDLRESKGALGRIARLHHRQSGGLSGENQDPQGSPDEAAQQPSGQGTDNGLQLNTRHEASAERGMSTNSGTYLQQTGHQPAGRHVAFAPGMCANGGTHMQQNGIFLAGRQQGPIAPGMYSKGGTHIQQHGADLGTLGTEPVGHFASVPPAGVPPQQASEEESKRTFLSRLYALTGDAKIPLLVDMLSRWLNDPTKGKLCIFAHHLSVLNAIGDGAGLSNQRGSTRKFIRIDGSTLPKQRQQEIKKFQTDPSVRIALLGITAAGVAVTLTAASTVWFAELFWTPAIMIQAEDRVHRIGQNSQVRCLYFVAKGTLDEVLWKLIEKKFETLGEFVEGKEKQKIVVDETYESIGELHRMFASLDDMDDDDKLDSADDDTGIDQELQLDDDVLHDIEELGQEEQMMLRDGDDDDEDDGGGDNQKLSVVEGGSSKVVGSNEEDAIVLLDDDDDDEGPSSSARHPTVNPGSAGAATAPGTEPPLPSRPLPPTCRFYGIRVGDPQRGLGLEICPFQHRVAVSGVSKWRRDRLGENSKPCVGDVLVKINGEYLKPSAHAVSQAVAMIRKCIKMPMMLTFIEEPQLQAAVRAEARRQKELQRQQIAERNKAASENVIDLIDDD